jgi:D-glycero-D-manno-heptose 1,7-bisphosphate phosphatase
MSRRAVFLDKDGTLVVNLPYNVDPRRVQFMPNALEGLARLRDEGFDFVLISNQSGVARGYFDEAALLRMMFHIENALAVAGVPLLDFYYCPHLPDGRVPGYCCECDCRKPGPGLMLRAAQEYGIDLRASFAVGDILDDIEAGNRAGCRTVLLPGGEDQWRSGPYRVPDLLATDLKQAASAITAACSARPQRRLTTAAISGGLSHAG